MGLSEQMHVRWQGVFTFNAANGIVRKLLPTMDKYTVTILDLTNVGVMDDSAALAVEELLVHALSLQK